LITVLYPSIQTAAVSCVPKSGVSLTAGHQEN